MSKLTEKELQAWVKQSRATGKALAGKSAGEGLTFMITASGAAKGEGVWKFRYRFGNRQSWVQIGRYPHLSLEEAQKRARRLRVQVDDGIDVATKKRQERIERREARTFRELADDYMTQAERELRAHTWSERKRHLDSDILPRLGTLRIDEVSGSDIVALVRSVGNRSPTVARQCFFAVNVIYQHGLATLAAKNNPCAGIRVSAIVGKHPRRQRVMLTEEELRRVLAALPKRAIGTALAIRILLATCVRKGELTNARWEQVDLKKALWWVPPENSKNGHGFTVPLAPTVLRWLVELKQLSRGSAWVLPGQRLTAPMHASSLNWTLSQIHQEIRTSREDLRRFSPHDLRSTARSYLAALGVDVVVAERCLNHALPGVLGIYTKYDFLEERRAALEKWAAFLEELERPRDSNVAMLRAA